MSKGGDIRFSIPRPWILASYSGSGGESADYRPMRVPKHLAMSQKEMATPAGPRDHPRAESARECASFFVGSKCPAQGAGFWPAFGRLFNSRNYFAGGYRTGGVRDTQRPPWRSLALFTACIAPCVAESHVTPTTHGHSTIDTRPRFILSSSPVAYGIPFFSPSQKSQ